MSNVSTKNDFAMPKILQGDIPELLEVCGYTTHRRDHFIATYRKGNYRLTFQENTILYQVREESQNKNYIYRTIFCGSVHVEMTDVEAMLLLQSINAVDITKVLPLREVFGTSIKTAKLIPLSTKTVDWWQKGMEEHKKACSQIQISVVEEGAAV